MQRLWISSVTDKAIKEGFKKLKNAREYEAYIIAHIVEVLLTGSSESMLLELLPVNITLN